MKRTIGVVARALGISAKTIRYYEEIGLVPPPRRESAGWISPGRRIYRDDEIERLRLIKKARALDFSIEDIKQLLTTFESGPPCGCGARPFLKTLIERKLGEIKDAVHALDELRAKLGIYIRSDIGFRRVKLLPNS